MIGQDLHTRFRDHFNAVYAPAGKDYAQFEPYYMFGYDQGLDDGNQAKDYDEAAGDLRDAYAQRYPQSDYDAGETAIRFGFEQGQMDAD